MAHALTLAPPELLRALVARLWLGGHPEPAVQGTLTLRPHQRSAVERLRRMLHEHGGALLADEVGLGKTYVGAALARDFERVLVVAPATLRAMWIRALSAAGARGAVASYATLSRSGGPAGPFDLLLLDEAHHARTPGTRRYARIAALADGARVLLLSATPIHNTRSDLAALIALFLGARAWAMDDDALARHVVRRERSDVALGHIPDASAPVQLEVGDDEDMLHAILALPPPLPPRGGGVGGALLAWGLVRQWASSNAALTGALRRRLVRASALDAALESGHLLSRRELASWVCDDRTIQLAFPELLSGVPPSNTARLRATLGEHQRAVHALLQRASESTWTDAERAELLREIRARHPGEKVAAFTQFADTARALFKHLRRDGGVAVLTARGAVVSGGTLSRSEAVARFAPRASGAAPPRDIERIDLLLATDLLSEGVNLQDASVVVHLDLPWTPARLEQRVGRSRRLGAVHARTMVYMLRPAASSESLLRVEARLRAKLRTASSALGGAGDILPTIEGAGNILGALGSADSIEAPLTDTSGIEPSLTDASGIQPSPPDASSSQSSPPEASSSQSSLPDASSSQSSLPDASSSQSSLPDATTIQPSPQDADSIQSSPQAAGSIPSSLQDSASIPSLLSYSGTGPPSTPDSATSPSSSPQSNIIPPSPPIAETSLLSFPAASITRSAPVGADIEDGAARRRELIVREIERWRNDVTEVARCPTAGTLLVAALRAPHSATLALVREGREYLLAAAMGDAELDDSPAIVLEVVRLAGGAPDPVHDLYPDRHPPADHRPPADGEPTPIDVGPLDAALDVAIHAATHAAIHNAVERVDRWAARRAATLASGAALPPYTQARRHALRRIATIAAHAPRHRRAEVARLAAIARRAATSPYGVGAERMLDDLATAEMASDEEWLRALGKFAAVRGSAVGTRGGNEASSDTALVVEPVALLVLRGLPRGVSAVGYCEGGAAGGCCRGSLPGVTAGGYRGEQILT